MRITVAAVGRAKAGPERALWEDYVKRLTWPVTLKEVEAKGNPPPAERMAREGALLLAALPQGATAVVLDGRGQALSSAALAGRLGKWRESVRELAFLIGGADGHGADVLARAKDTSVAGMVQAGVLYSKAGKVRLLRREELAKDWDPRFDARLTVWECAQQLIRRLNEKGEDGAAVLVKQMGGGRSEDARALAYRLYAICERKKWADEALAYNALVVSWPEIEKKAARMEGEAEQGKLL